MRIVYALVLIAGLAAVVADHLASPSSRTGSLAGRFRRSLRALRRAMPVNTEKIARGSCRSDPCAIGSKFPRGPFAYEVRARARRDASRTLEAGHECAAMAHCMPAATSEVAVRPDRPASGRIQAKIAAEPRRFATEPLASAHLNPGQPEISTHGDPCHRSLQLRTGCQQLGKDTESSLSIFHL